MDSGTFDVPRMTSGEGVMSVSGLHISGFYLKAWRGASADSNSPLRLFEDYVFWAALRSPAKSLTFSGLDGNYH